MNAISIEVIQKVVHSPKLFSFKTTRPKNFRFEAGQFVRLGIMRKKSDECIKNTDTKQNSDDLIFRAYSVVSSPYDEYLEFFSVVVPNGAFTSQLQYLKTGDVLFLDPTPYGFLTLSRYQTAAQNLWLLATGTGLAPFLSILQDIKTWQDYQNIALVYSVSYLNDLAYIDKINALQQSFKDMLDDAADFVFIPIVTRQKVDGALHARLPKLLHDGTLVHTAKQKLADMALDDDAHVMLCGNPSMVEDTKQTLKDLGLSMNRRGIGAIAVENYW